VLHEVQCFTECSVDAFTVKVFIVGTMFSGGVENHRRESYAINGIYEQLRSSSDSFRFPASLAKTGELNTLIIHKRVHARRWFQKRRHCEFHEEHRRLESSINKKTLVFLYLVENASITNKKDSAEKKYDVLLL